MKDKKVLLPVLPCITLVLEALPYGAILNFAEPYGETTRKTFSYFSLIPYGYANFTPFITAIITVLIFALLSIYCLTDKKSLFTAVRYFLIADIILSLCPLMSGINSFSIVGGLISACLIAELVLLFYINRKPR